MPGYRISNKAIEDLNKIWLYTFENWSIEQADRYYKLVFDEIDFICEKPAIGMSIDHIKIGYRMARVMSHLIFYREAEDNVIEVVRILHKRMDIESRLLE